MRNLTLSECTTLKTEMAAVVMNKIKLEEDNAFLQTKNRELEAPLPALQVGKVALQAEKELIT